MNTIIAYFLVFVAAITLIGVYYRTAIRPLAIDSVRFSLFRVRDELRQLAIAEEADVSGFSFRHLEAMLNQMINDCGFYNVAGFIEFKVRYRSRPRPAYPDIERFDNEASPELKKLEAAALDQMLRMMVLNSPGWVCVSLVVFLVDVLVKKTIRSWVNVENRVLWYDSVFSSTAVNGRLTTI